MKEIHFEFARFINQHASGEYADLGRIILRKNWIQFKIISKEEVVLNE